MHPSPEVIKVTTVKGITIVNFVAKSLSHSNADQLGEELLDLIRGPCKIVLNFSNVEYMSSLPLAKLVAMRKKAKHDQATVKLCGLQQQLRHIHQITLLHKLFEVYDDEEQALNSFG